MPHPFFQDIDVFKYILLRQYRRSGAHLDDPATLIVLTRTTVKATMALKQDCA